MKQIDMNVFREDIINTIRDSLIVLDSDLRVIFANDSFYKTFKVNRNETKNKRIFELGNGQWDIPELRELLEKILPQDSSFHDFRIHHIFPNIGEKFMLINAKQLKDGSRDEKFIVVAIDDISERHNMTEELKRAKVIQIKYEAIEKFHKIAIDRELKMVELKARIRELEKELSQK